MNQLKTVALKELKSYFLSPVGLIFLGIFLAVNLFVFFTSATFFARNIADIRPMFQWMPMLLIFLVAAISMRSWSQEHASGNMEMLMTMPVTTTSLVLGKLAAGLILVTIALALTLPLPIMVSVMGNIDAGPVVGGYLGALFLAAAYLAMGMCVSARTDNQIVSLMVTGIIGALFYLIGSDTVAAFFSANTAEVLRSLGTGSRFYNIERGVLDIRDFAYYISLAAFFVVLNIHFINDKRADNLGTQSKARHHARQIFVYLFAANALLLNVWLAPVTTARADMTEDGRYSISEATENIVNELNEPLLIAGYFSEKTHPLLAPLVPSIRDFLVEYENISDGKVKVKFENPNADEELEQEIAQAYNIKSIPFQVDARHQRSVVNAYFHLLIKYGDQYEVLSIDDLVEVEATADDVRVELKNLEYSITKSIKKVSSGFQSIESVFASMNADSKMTFYVTPSTLPEDFKEIPTYVNNIANELAKKSDGKFTFEEVNLDEDSAARDRVQTELGFRPMATDLFGENTFFLHILLETGDKKQQLVLQGTPTEAAIKTTIEGAFKRNTPGFMKTIGIFTEKPEQQQPNPQLPPQMQPPQPRPDFTVLEQQLSEEFKVRRVELNDGVVPGDVDILVVGKTGAMTDKQQFAIDQFLMAGGSVVALVGDKKIEAGRQGISAVTEDVGLKNLLKHYGVEIKEGFVLDEQNASFPVPVEERKGMFVMKKIKMMDYPFFPDIREDGLNQKHIALSGLQNIVFNWGSAIEVNPPKDVQADTLLETTDEAWTRTSPQVLPTSFENAAVEFAPPDEQKKFALAATLQGAFTSYFADKDSPLFEDPAGEAGAANETGATGDAGGEKKIDRTGRTLKKSQGGRLAVVGSSEFLSDITASIGSQVAGNIYANNFQFARNLIDWTTAETDLLSIRTGSSLARTLEPLEDAEQTTWEAVHYLFVLLALLAIGLTAYMRRRNVTSIMKMEAGK